MLGWNYAGLADGEKHVTGRAWGRKADVTGRDKPRFVSVFQMHNFWFPMFC
jgi:hypothetical protein